ncbi:MAG: M42 family metallopeptidase [Trueperaceae bacterium]
MDERFRAICDAPGVSGFEDAVQAVVADLVRPVVDELWRDRMGNLIALKRARPGVASPRRLAYAAHVDEIGMMVSHVDEAGFVRFRAVGGLDPRALPSQRVTVHASRGDGGALSGVIATQSGWLGTPADRERVFPIPELYVDLGRPGDEVRALVEVGDVITFAAGVEALSDRVWVGHNFDDRIGVYCLVEAMRRLAAAELDVDVYAVFTAQEEVGVRGMPTAAHAIAADIAVALDGSLPSDTPYARPHERQCALGHGTGIYLMDNRTIGTPRLVRGLIDTCERHGIAYQRNLGGGTDASEIQRHGLGAWATTIGAPVRYMHSTVQLCHADDVEATTALLVAFAGEAAGLLPDDWR